MTISQVRMEKAMKKVVEDRFAIPARTREAVKDAILRVKLKKALDYDEFM
ncbi:hypothetical protein KW805_03920 [Candidatus Pacearchaeota archaeon]|nr:hypothetical protein [Candidatus Pacearchaeota archaeon]